MASSGTDALGGRALMILGVPDVSLELLERAGQGRGDALSAVGAGGIGLELETTLRFVIYGKGAAILLVISVTLFILDCLSFQVRERLM
jgi:hypothetical protein